MEISPFSATIHLKNSSLKDKNGNQLYIPSGTKFHVSKNEETNVKHARDILHHENANRMLQTHLEDALSDCDEMHQTNANLEKVIEVLNSKLTTSAQKVVELSKTTIEHEALEKYFKKQTEEALDQATANGKLDLVVNRLKKTTT